ncbi:mechanosensitive ion channel family protein [Altererythrobacter sp. C41]|uniref:mechanosensitive ion channel family protein n=1 Tax=Altererythrobacter sp. C41 TaxID=2806021 RepID=UPI001931DF1A|nr:mechanosensitive ion channel domain-containing protein [Altererythrobacter sp. C41]MBM0170223.1 mechanosensitive ion channel [Altererythrobacter sp. C41]
MDFDLTDLAIVWGARVLSAGLILAAGLWFAFFLSRVVRRQALNHPHIDSTLGTFLSLVIRYAVIALVLIVVLQQFGVQTTSLVAVLGAGALAIGLALQGTLGNVAAGIILALMRPYRIGEFVEINGQEGKVTNLDLLFTELETLDDRRIFIPNGQALANPIVNFTTMGRRRCIIVVGIGYEDDIDKAIEVLREVMGDDPRTLQDPPLWFGTESLGEFSVDISARAWIATDDYLQYRADMLHRIKEAFDAEGIEIPYPHSVEISKGEIELRMPPIKPRVHPGAAANE